ncbi:MAG TPA: FG-GAP-like repeat-containing protein [Pirellulaceae bacterium]
MLAADWQNPLLPVDVNGDAVVTPLDALNVINELNNPKISGAGGTLPNLALGVVPPPYLDVSGEGSVTAQDALMVINYLSNQATSNASVAQSSALPHVSAAVASSGELLLNTPSFAAQEMPAIAVTAGGSIAVWASAGQDGSDWGVYGQRLNATGQKIGPEFQVSQTTKSAQRAPTIDAWPDGRFVVTWESLEQPGDPGWGVYARLFNADGTSASNEFRVNQTTSGTQRAPSVAVLADGSFAVAFEGKGLVDKTHKDDYEIFVRQFSSAGVPLSSQQRVNSDTKGYQEHAVIAASPAGGFAITWNGSGPGDSAGVFLRRYRSATSPIAKEVLVNSSFTRGDQRQASLDIAPDGRILVAWASTDHQSGWGVYAQQYKANGGRLGSEILVNQYLNGTQWHPAIAANPDGTFLVAWEGLSKFDPYGIVYRKFSAAGKGLTNEQLLNQTTIGTQRDVAIGVGTSSFIAAWDGYGPGDAAGVFAIGAASSGPAVNQPPSIALPATQSLNEDAALAFSAAASNAISISDIDAGNDAVQVTLAATHGTLTITNRAGLAFSTGDGQDDANMTFTGSLADINTDLGTLFYVPTHDYNGTATLTISANDLGHNGIGGAKSDTETLALNVRSVNDAPVAVNDAYPTDEDATLTVAVGSGVLKNDSDVDSNSLSASLVAQTAHGTVTLAQNGSFSYVPASNFHGTDSFTYKASDGTAASNVATVTITVNPVNDPPVAVADSYTVNSGDVLTVSLVAAGVLANDSDADQDSITAQVASNPAHGTLDLHANGTFVYIPTAGFSGTDTFTYQASDGTALSNAAAVTITVSGTSASLDGSAFTLREGTAFNTDVARTFTVPATSSILQVSYDALNFDTQSQGAVRDAFEVALVDSNGQTLVHTIAGSRDAFYNQTEGQTAATGANTQASPGLIQLDLSHIPAGTQATLVVRLVNDDTDTNTSVHISSLKLVSGSLNTPVGVASAAAINKETVAATDFARLNDITSDMSLVFGGTSLNKENTVLFTDVALTNSGNAMLRGPLVVVIDSISDPSVAVQNPDGFTPAGLPYFNYHASIPGGTLTPGETTASRTLNFLDPSGNQFTFHASIYSLPDSLPTLTEIPTLEALVGQQFSYQIEASDADNDGLTYSLAGGPPTMSIDQTGKITWTPTADDLGTQQVTVRIDDGQGGTVEQSFTLVVRDNVPNRPPIITSSPVTDAGVAVSFQISDLPVGEGPVGVSTGNFDGSGNSVITANQTNQSVSLGQYTTAALAQASVRTTILGEPPPRTDQLFEQGYTVDVGAAFNRNLNINATTSADFNGDGIADLAVTQHSEGPNSNYQEAVAVMLGIGDGTYQPAIMAYQALPADNTNPLTGILARDFDKDGNMDLLVGEYGAKNLIFIKGHGDGTFDAPIRTATNFRPQYLRTDDFNHDGQLDIALVGTIPVPGRGDNWQPEILFGNGDGTFQPPVDYVNVPAGESGRYLADIQVGDLDGKNGPDLIVADWDNGDIEVRLNDGTGNFGPPTTMNLNTSEGCCTTGHGPAGAIILGDFDGDGTLDMVVSGGFGTEIFYKGNGDGTFVRPVTSSPVIAELGTAFSHAYADTGNTAIDLNGDGKLDVYAAERSKNVLSVGLGRGDGTFDYHLYFAQPGANDPTIPQYGAGFASPVAIDANHDGVMDMAVGSNANNGAPGRLTILLGDQPGSFRSPEMVIGSSNGNAFVDLNNDAQPDIVALRNPLWTSLANPDGSFPPFVRADGSNIGTYPYLATADFNDDGNQDVVYESDDKTVVNLGLGNGLFQSPIILGAGLTGGTQFAAADLTGDGKPEVISSTTTIQLYVNNTGTSFTRLPDVNGRFATFRNQGWGVAAADFDGDGITDLVTTAVGTPNQFLFFKGHQVANPTDVSDLFDAPVVTTPGMDPIYEMIPADFNHDGYQDLVLLGGFQDFYVMLNTGNKDGSFAAPTKYAVAEGYMTVGDFNGDGNLDIGLANGHDFPSIRLGIGDGTFGGTIYFPSLGGAGSVDAADVNGDGKSDFLSLTGNANVATFPSSNVYLSRLPGIQAVATGDLNGDGQTDAIVADFGMSHLTPLLGDGHGNLTRQLDLLVARGPIAVTMADLNNDHHDDIISVNRSSNSISVLVGSASGSFTRTDLATGSRPVAVAVKDILGDSAPDLVVANGDETSLSLFKNLGNGQFAAGTLLSIGIHPSQVSLDDVNGDGKADIVATSETDKAYVIALNLGNGAFAVQTPIPTAASVGGMALGDLNGDGKADLVITNPDEHRVSLYIGLGAGSFATPQPISFDHSPTAVNLADMNGDGQPDIVTTNSDSDTATVIISKFNPAAAYRYQVTASDPDGDTISYSLQSGPAGMNINAATGQITWSATPDQIGTHQVVIQASDGKGGLATQQYNLEVSAENGNSPPRFVTTPVTTGLSTTDYHYAARAADADKDPVRYSIASGPDGLTIDPNSGDLSWGDSVGHGLQFNGQDDEVVVRGSPSLHFDSGLTFSMWVKFDKTPQEMGHDAYLVSNLDTDLAARFLGSVNVFEFNYRGIALRSVTPVEDGQWYQLTATYSFGNTMRLFVNGVQEAETDISQVQSKQDDSLLTIGNTSLINGLREVGLAGSIDSVRVFNTALSPQQAADEYNRVGAVAPGLVGDWQLNETDGPLALDSSGYGNDGTLSAEYAGRSMRTTFTDRVTPAGRSGDYPVILRATDGRGGFDEQSFTLHVAALPPATLSGTVFNDQNADQQQAGDPGLAGWTVYLDLDNNGTLDDFEPTATTDSQGHFKFKNLAAGSYKVAIAGQPGWKPTTPLSGAVPVVIAPGQGAADQYASSVIGFSSQFSTTNWSAAQALGAPNTSSYGDFSTSWAAATVNGGPEFLTLGVATPSLARGVTVRETWGNGFVTQIDLLDTNNVLHTVWQDVDPSQPGAAADFTVNFPPTNYLVQGVKVYVDGNHNLSTWEEIDSVQLLAADIDQVTFGETTIGVAAGNRPPAFASSAPTAGQVNDLYTYQPQVKNLDGRPLTFDVLVAPAGFAMNPETGGIAWLPTADESGANRVLIRVKDDRGLVAIQDFTIQVATAPTAPIFTSDPLLFSALGVAYHYQVRAQDAEGGPLTYSLTNFPTGMTIDPQSGLITWTPANPQQNGQQHVTIVVTDPTGLTAEQDFGILVAGTATNHDPEILSAPRKTAGLDRPYRYQVAVFDLDGDQITYSLASPPSGMTIDQTGMIRWTPDQLGDFPVSILASDGRGGNDSQSFTVSVTSQLTNSAPQFTSVPPAAAVAGEIFAYDALATDADGDALQYILDQGPAGMSLDPTTGTLRWQTADTTRGNFPITIRAADPYGAEATQAFTLSIRSANEPPAITSIPPTEAAINFPYIYSVAAADPFDPVLTYSLPDHPAGMTIDADIGVITWTPTAQQLGLQSVTVQAANDHGGVALQTYDIVVTNGAPNLPPVINSTPPKQATVGDEYQYIVDATDPEGLAVHYQLKTFPIGMTIDANSGVISWTPTVAQIGTNPVTVVAIDPGGKAAIQSFLVTALPVNHAPTINSTAPTKPISGGALFRYTVAATDQDHDVLTYTLTQSPSGMSIDPFGRITWQTVPADRGQHPVSITVDDGRGGTKSQSFTLNVVDDTTPPKVAVVPATNLVYFANSALIHVSATDDVGIAALSLAMDGQPISLDDHGNAVVPFPADQHTRISTFTATAVDPAGNVTHASTTVKFFNSADITTAPQVGIISPADTAVVTAPTDIVGSIVDDNIREWHLLIKPADATDDFFTQIGNGTTTVNDSVLGHFDPTLLENGSYVLRLDATDNSGNEVFTDNRIGVSGDLKLGNFQLSFTDLTIPVNGIPITVTRTYDSLTAGDPGAFGYGWRLEYRDTHLVTGLPKSGLEDFGIYSAFKPGTKVYLTLPGGKREGFTFNPSIQSLFDLTIVHPAFTPDPGVTDALGARGGTFILGDDGGVYSGDGEPYNPAAEEFGGGYTLTTKDGTIYQIDGNTGQLNNVTDRNGNTLTFSDSGISGPAGTQVTFQRDAQGHIVAVSDPSGKSIKYSYTTAGDLSTVTDRAGNKTQFTYRSDRAHYLDTIVDPLGRTGVRTNYDADGRLTRTIKTDNSEVNLTYDLADSLSTITDALGHSTTFEYDPHGNVVATIDALGGISHATYDANDNRLTSTNPLGQTTTYTYDTNNNLSSISDPLGNMTRQLYDDHNSLLSTINPLGQVTDFSYNSSGNLTALTNALGQSTTSAADLNGNLSQVMRPDGATVQFGYSGGIAKPTSSINWNGLVSSTIYDVLGEPTSQSTVVDTPTGPQTATEFTVYDADGNITQVTDALGNVASSEYNAAGQVVASVDALGHRTTYDYDTVGRLIKTTYADGTFELRSYDSLNLISVTDPAGRITRYEYDALGRQTAIIYPDDTPNNLLDNSRTTFEYDAAGDLTAQVNELGQRTEFDYDAAGRKVASRDPLGNETDYDYDAAGNLIAVHDPLARTTTYILDAAGRQTGMVNADGTQTDSVLSSTGTVLVAHDENGHETQYTYTPDGKVASVTDPLGDITLYQYDTRGLLVRQTDANQHVTQFQYDLLGQQTARILPAGEAWKTEYNAVGLVSKTTDPNGVTITYQYDARNRLHTKTRSDGVVFTYNYTPTGQLSSVVDARGVTTYTYDARDRLTKRTDPDGQSIAYTYDAAGEELTQTTLAGVVQYSYDAAGRMISITDPVSHTTRYTYDAAGELTQTQFWNNVTETRTYDLRGQLTRQTASNPSGIITDFSYTLDAADRVIATDGGGEHVDYIYDAANRLTREHSLGARDINYTYDAAGNRLTRIDASGTTTYTFDSDDRLLTQTIAGVTTTYTYDAAGNLRRIQTGGDHTDYTWDAENRLVRADVTTGGVTKTEQYKYDAFGNRISTIDANGETRYMLDLQGDLSQVAAEYTSGGVLTATIVNGVGETRGGVATVFLTDHLGSVRAVVDGAGAVTARYLYDAFGQVISTTGISGASLRFTGEPLSTVTGLEYFRARFYDPSTGRFISADPFAGRVQDPLSRQKYQYANLDPINHVDHSGLVETEAELSVVSTIIGYLAKYALPVVIGVGAAAEARAFGYSRGEAILFGVATGAISAYVGPPIVAAAVATNSIDPLLVITGVPTVMGALFNYSLYQDRTTNPTRQNTVEAQNEYDEQTVAFFVAAVADAIGGLFPFVSLARVRVGPVAGPPQRVQIVETENPSATGALGPRSLTANELIVDQSINSRKAAWLKYQLTKLQGGEPPPPDGQ